MLQCLVGPTGRECDQAECPVGEDPCGRQIPCARLHENLVGELPRIPVDFSDYARDAAATGVWNP